MAYDPILESLNPTGKKESKPGVINDINEAYSGAEGDNEISGNKVQFNFDEMIPGTIYFRPDQQNSMFERDPENQVIIQYNIFTGEKIKEIPIGG